MPYRNDRRWMHPPSTGSGHHCRTCEVCEVPASGDLCMACELAEVREVVTEVRRERDAALDLLHAMATQHWCGCGHPHCNRCADDRDNVDLLRRHGLAGPWTQNESAEARREVPPKPTDG